MAARPCPECGAEVPSDAPEGLCPSCLLARGLGSASGPQPVDEPASGGASPDAFGARPTGSAGSGGMPSPARAAPPREALAPDFSGLQIQIIEPVGQGGMGWVYKA